MASRQRSVSKRERERVCVTRRGIGRRENIKTRTEDGLAVLDELGAQGLRGHEGQRVVEDGAAPSLVGLVALGQREALVARAALGVLELDEGVDDQAAVAEDVLADGRDGDAAVGDVEGFELRARQDDGDVAAHKGCTGGGEGEEDLLAKGGKGYCGGGGVSTVTRRLRCKGGITIFVDDDLGGCLCCHGVVLPEVV